VDQVERVRRIGAYGACLDDDRILVARDRRGCRYLPGAVVGQGEHPVDAVVRAVADQTGLTVSVNRLRRAVTHLVPTPGRENQYDRLLFDVRATGGELDGAEWVPVAGVADDLSVPADEVPEALLARSRAATGPERPPRSVQRFGAYGLVTDPAGRVLLTLIAPGKPGCCANWPRRPISAAGSPTCSACRADTTRLLSGRRGTPSTGTSYECTTGSRSMSRVNRR
jgi:8-oxo-dGTP diphosphatase